MPVRCAALSKIGEPCGAYVIAGSEFCFIHDPTRAAERQAARKLGGYRRRAPRGRRPESVPEKIRTMANVLSVLDFALSESLCLENSLARGRLLVAIAGEYRQSIQISELETRLEALERQVLHGKHG